MFLNHSPDYDKIRVGGLPTQQGMVGIVLLWAVAGHAKTGTFGDSSGVSDCSFASSADSGVAEFDGSVLAGGIPWTWLG